MRNPMQIDANTNKRTYQILVNSPQKTNVNANVKLDEFNSEVEKDKLKSTNELAY